MKFRWFIVGLCFIIPFCSFASFSFAQRIPFQELPQKIKDIVESEIEGTEFRINRVTKRTQDGQTVYDIEGRDRYTVDIDMLIAEDGTILDLYQEGQFRILNDRLCVERSPYRLRSIYIPEAGDLSQAPGAMYQAISDISKVGCNTLVFDLYGFNEDGSKLSNECSTFIRDIVRRLVYSDVEAMCRILGPDAPKDEKGRLNAVKSAARALKDHVQLLCWIDGPNARKLAKEFQKLAPKLVVAAPGADVNVIKESKEYNKSKPTIIFGHPADSSAGYILKGHPEDYQYLDEQYALPCEKEPWEPDNSVLSDEERKEGFISLFDGKTLNGWIILGGNKDGFAVKNGNIEWIERGGGALQTCKRYDDFILRIEYKIANNGNSGIHVRAPRSNRASKIGFELQFLGDHGRPASKSSTGSIYSVVAPTMNPSKPAGEWNEVELVCDGPHVQVTMNGHKIQDINFDDYEELKYRLRDGFLRLTDHGHYVAYRNIRIKEL